MGAFKLTQFPARMRQVHMFSDVRQLVALFNKDAWKNTVYGTRLH